MHSARTFEALAATVDELIAENEALRASRTDVDAHEFLKAVYNNEALPMTTRLEAAKAAIRHEVPPASKLFWANGLAQRLERARKRMHPETAAPQLLLTYQKNTR